MLDRYWLDAIEIVMSEDYVDALDDAALSSAVVSTATYLAHITQD
jgi:hypothetical protein